MRLLRILAAVGVSMALVAGMSCEDTDPIPGETATISLTAVPAAVPINALLGEQEGSTTLVAQVIDGAVPLEDVQLFFTATGGTLESAGSPRFTDQNGITQDTLTLALTGDPETVTVTVKGATLEASLDISKDVNLGSVDPVADITANPPNGQRTGLPFTLDGSGSTFDSSVVNGLSCFDWEILSSKAAFQSALNCSACISGSCSNTCRTRGQTLSVLQVLIGEEGVATDEQDLSIVLRVSDDPVFTCPDGVELTLDEENRLSPFPATLIYPIDCDLTPPVVNAGGNQSGSLSGGVISFGLTGTASDAEFPNGLEYLWDCGNGTSFPFQSGVCTYDTPGIFSATFIVTNTCGLSAADSIVVDIDPE